MAAKTNGGVLLCKKLMWALALPAISGCALWDTGAEAPGIAYVDTLDLSGATCGLGKRLQLQKSVDGHALTVGGKTYAREIKVSFAELGLEGECWVKDLWRQTCEGKHSGFYVVTVPAHATKLVKMRPVSCPKCE